MEQAGQRCSEQERRADDAARQVESQLKAAYLQQHIGDVLPGTVTGVTHFGLFVTLDGLYVDAVVGNLETLREARERFNDSSA